MAVVGLWRNPAGSERAKGFGVGSKGSAAFDAHSLQSGRSAFVKSFGRWQAYESPRRTNPRALGGELWGFADLALVARTGVTVGVPLEAVFQDRPMVSEGWPRC
jgi:hypothetical protein